MQDLYLCHKFTKVKCNNSKNTNRFIGLEVCAEEITVLLVMLRPVCYDKRIF